MAAPEGGLRLSFSERLIISEPGAGVPKAESIDWYDGFVMRLGRRCRMFAVTGRKGTQIYFVNFRSDAANHIEKLDHVFENKRGSVCKWHPSQKMLLVAIPQYGRDGDELLILNFTKQEAGATEIYKCFCRISQLRWSSDGKFILVCAEKLNGVIAIQHVKGDNNRYKWTPSHIVLPSPPYTGDFVPDAHVLIISGPQSKITVFRISSDPRANSWDLVRESEGSGFVQLAFAFGGNWVAAIRCVDNRVCIWPYERRGGHANGINDGQRQMLDNEDPLTPLSITWHNNSLITYNNTAMSICAYEHSNNVWSKCHVTNDMGSNLFNKITKLSFQHMQNMFVYSTTRGFLVVGYLCPDDVDPPAGQRNFIEELDYFTDLLAVDFEKETDEAKKVFDSFNSNFSNHIAIIQDKAHLSDSKFQRFQTKLQLLLTTLQDSGADESVINEVEQLPHVDTDFGNVAQLTEEAFVNFKADFTTRLRTIQQKAHWSDTSSQDSASTLGQLLTTFNNSNAPVNVVRQVEELLEVMVDND